MRTSSWRLLVVAAASALALTLTGVVPTAAQRPAAAAMFACPMHPEVRTAAPGACPRCGMKLVPGGAVDNAHYALKLRTSPRAPRPAEPVSLEFEVQRSPAGDRVQAFEEVHERPFHLFVVSDDLSHFDHIHPELAADGSLTVQTTFPRAGRYQLFADFVPRGGTPQFIARTVYTAGAAGDPAAARPRLEPDVVPQHTADSTVELQLPPQPGLVAGEVQAFRIRVSDRQSGVPVRDLESFLGAPAHLLVVSDDLVDGLHGHPALEYSTASGPDVTFEMVFPRAGLYRMWVQFQRKGRVAVASFTVPIAVAPVVR